jgi:hypothetical protein
VTGNHELLKLNPYVDYHYSNAAGSEWSPSLGGPCCLKFQLATLMTHRVVGIRTAGLRVQCK